MFANLRPTIARWDLLLLDWILPGHYNPRHARRSVWGFLGRRRAALLKIANHGYVTALEFLVGIGFPEAERYAAEFGDEVAEAYRKAYGAEPHRGCLMSIKGRMFRCCGYANVADLYAGAYCYVKTREFLTAQRNSTMRELLAA